jgi:hypothetical protein
MGGRGVKESWKEIKRKIKKYIWPILLEDTMLLLKITEKQ